MGEKKRRQQAGIRWDDEYGYLLNFRRCLLLTLKADTAPAKEVQRFVDTLADAAIGPHATDNDRVNVLEAWLMGRVKGTDANVTIAMQELAEDLHKAAPSVMDMLHQLAATQRAHE